MRHEPDDDAAASSRRRPLLQAPAIQALLLMLVALAAVGVLGLLLDTFLAVQLPAVATALLQGVLAALLAQRRGLARWWWWILLGFPLAAMLVQMLRLPPVIFLGGFVFLLLLFWSTFRSQVPFYPSRPATWKAVEELLPAGRPLNVIDIGSGLGGLVLHLAAARGDSRFTGIEIAPLPWMVSRLRGRLRGSQAEFVRGDYLALDFADYDVVFAYLSPAAMTQLWSKARQEMRPGSILMSFEFPIAGIAPDALVRTHPDAPILHVWHM